MLQIQMLGKFRIAGDHIHYDEKLSSKLVGLLSFLLMNSSREVSRDKLLSYLWPDSNEEAAKSNLRFNLWNLRKIIPLDRKGEELVLSGKDSCRINENYEFYCDRLELDRFRSCSEYTVEELVRLKDLFQGDFLEGLYLRNCNEFNELVLFERVACQNRQVEILKSLLEVYEEEGRFEEGLQILMEMEAIEPYNERFAWKIMNLYAREGNRAAALRYYKKFENSLRRHLNISPNDELKTLYASLQEDYPVPEQPILMGRNKKINLRGYGIPSVDFFWLSDILLQVIRQADCSVMKKIDDHYLADLAFIQRELLRFLNAAGDGTETIGTIPDVRIIQAFVRLMEMLGQTYQVEVVQPAIEEIDEKSKMALEYLKNRKVAGVLIQSPKES